MKTLDEDRRKMEELFRKEEALYEDSDEEEEDLVDYDENKYLYLQEQR